MLWDFLEMNWIPEKTHSILQGNLSQVNAFALAFELVMNGGTPSDPTVPLQLIFGFGPGGLRAKILAEIAAAGAPWSNLIIPNPTPGILGNPDDGNSGAIAAALGASICRSTLGYYPGFPVPQPERNLYYTKPPIFQYAAIIHKYALDNHAFCFGYDEVAQDNGPTNQVWNPTSLAITIRGLT